MEGHTPPTAPLTGSGKHAVNIDINDWRQEGEVAQVIVRDLDNWVVAGLKRKARLHGNSLEQELREVLAAAALPAPEERLAIARRIRAMTPVGIEQSDSTDLIRGDRDRR